MECHNTSAGIISPCQSNPKVSTGIESTPSESQDLIQSTCNERRQGVSDVEEKKLATKIFRYNNKKFISPIVALLLACVCGATTGLSNAIAKLLTNVGPFTISSVRFSIIFAISFSVVIWRKDNVFPYGKRTWLLVRSVVGIINSAAIYFAVKHMPIGDMTMIAASSTIFVCVYGRIFLSEPIQKINVFNIALVLIGILLITKPSVIFGNDDDSVYETDELALYAVGTLTALSIFIFPNISIALRALKDLHWSVILSVFSLTGFFSTFVAAVLFDGDVGTKHIFPVSTVEWAFLVSIGFISFIVQVSFTKALQLEMAAKVSMERKAADVIFAFLYQIVIFAETPTLYSVGGAVLILIALIISGIAAMAKEKKRLLGNKSNIDANDV